MNLKISNSTHIPDTAPLTERLRAHPACATLSAQTLDSIAAAIERSSDPAQAIIRLQLWLDAGGALACHAWTEPEFLKTLLALFVNTPALCAHFNRFPGRTQPVIQAVLSRNVNGGNAWRFMLTERLKIVATHAERLAELRHMRVECMLQIAALDLLLLSPLNETVRAVSDLADACIGVALQLAIEQLRPRFGMLEGPRAQSPLVVFALGKLGGKELNYSSDIDLVFAHGNAAAAHTQGGTRSVSADNYVTALAGELISVLDKVTQDGRVFRVDVRLRPHGSVGALVRGADSMLDYFQTEGRTWERQAWLKARSVAGDIELGNSILERLQPFIFRRYLTNESIADMQALKRQIELAVARRGESEHEVKLGRGGIRDIEFTVQFMQLLFGSEHPAVRGGNTLRALYELKREGLILDSESVPLTNAYIFLRQVEHRLQLHGDLQTHLLPNDPRERRRIALSLGYADAPDLSALDAFEADRVKHTNKTREVFMRLFANLFKENQGTDSELSDQLLAPEPDFARIARLLPHYGFPELESTARELVDFSREGFALSSPSRTRKLFAAVAPKLLKALAATGEPEQALGRFARVAGSLGAKAVFFLTLNENPWLLKMTAELAAWSEYLTSILLANPGLFDELVDSLMTGARKSALQMEAELARIALSGDIADTLRAYRAGELLRIGVADLIHSANLEQTQEELSDLAQVLLRAQLAHCLKEQRQRRGEVLDAEGKPVVFAVLALGKFGGREMNYGSDLDVLYFYSEDGATADGFPAVSYFAELAQNLSRAMSRATSLGTLYELDARLRPNGNKGPLALSPGAFKRYWQDGQLADWERLALTRARFAAGDESLGERALHLLRSAVFSPLRDTAALAPEVVAMRMRLQENAEPANLKRGPGGIMDIEFTAQYLQLIHGPSQPKLRLPNTEQSLKALVKAGMLGQHDGDSLLESYVFLRTLENRLRIVHGLSSHTLPDKPGALRKLALRAGYADDESACAEEKLSKLYKNHSARTREIFLKVCCV